MSEETDYIKLKFASQRPKMDFKGLNFLPRGKALAHFNERFRFTTLP